jgi:hypothetical protein
MPLTAGSVSASTNITADSMAAAIEAAFIQEWPEVIKDRGLPEDDQDRPEVPKEFQLLFVAIARGVISHLMEHPKSFKVEVTLPSGFNETTASGTVTEIKVKTNNSGELE